MSRQENPPAREEPWLRRTESSSLVILLLLSALFGPYALLIVVGPWAGLPASIVAVTVYNKLRYGGGSFGPRWLEMVDMGVFFGNGAVCLFSLGQIIRGLLD